MLALGIDPGTATTGYGFIRIEPDGSLLAVKYGVITTPKDTPASERLVMLYDQLQELLQEYSHRCWAGARRDAALPGPGRAGRIRVHA